MSRYFRNIAIFFKYRDISKNSIFFDYSIRYIDIEFDISIYRVITRLTYYRATVRASSHDTVLEFVSEIWGINYMEILCVKHWPSGATGTTPKLGYNRGGVTRAPRSSPPPVGPHRPRRSWNNRARPPNAAWPTLPAACRQVVGIASCRTCDNIRSRCERHLWKLKSSVGYRIVPMVPTVSIAINSGVTNTPSKKWVRYSDGRTDKTNKPVGDMVRSLVTIYDICVSTFTCIDRPQAYSSI